MTSFLDLPYDGADPHNDARDNAARVAKAAADAAAKVGAFVMNASSREEAQARLGLHEVRDAVVHAAAVNGVPKETVERALIRRWDATRNAGRKRTAAGAPWSPAGGELKKVMDTWDDSLSGAERIFDGDELLGYAKRTNPHNDRWTLTTANGITLVADAADLDEARRILKERRTARTAGKTVPCEEGRHGDCRNRDSAWWAIDETFKCDCPCHDGKEGARRTAGPGDTREGRECDPNEILRQIGSGNVAAISGGRAQSVTDSAGRTTGVYLPSGQGYGVVVYLDWDDTYVVQRVFGGQVKGEERDVYFDGVGDAAYRAGMHVNVSFGGHSRDSKLAAAGDLVGALRKALQDAFAFYFRAHGAHWNVTGGSFSEYHALFGEIADDVYSSIDPLAENLRKLGAEAPSSLDASMVDALGAEDGMSTEGTALAATLIEANAAALASIQAAFAAADAEGEEGIANFLAERIDMHQKWAWQLKASVGVTARTAAVRFPDVTVALVGEDGNAFAILGRVTKALKRAGASKEEVDEFMAEATSGDYDHLLRTVMAWVEVE